MIYKSKKSGDIIEVVETSGNFSKLSNGKTIANRVLEEEYAPFGQVVVEQNSYQPPSNDDIGIDIDVFLGKKPDPNLFNTIATQIKTVDTSRISDSQIMTDPSKRNFSVQKEEPAIDLSTNKDLSTRTANLATNQNPQNIQAKQEFENDLLKKYSNLSEQAAIKANKAAQRLLKDNDISEDEIEIRVDVPRTSSPELEQIYENPVSYNNPYANANPQQNQPQISRPQTNMFSNIKRITPFKVTLKIEDKIPRKEFIKLWEDSYNDSIIDFLCDDIFHKIMQNPSIIKDEIRDKLELYTYGRIKTRKKTTAKKTAKKPVRKTVKKPTTVIKKSEEDEQN